jgi:hypothetical protein
MINRRILLHPEELDNFDFFNDAKDTVQWLKRQQTADADLLAASLQEKYRHWLRHFPRNSSGPFGSNPV